MSAFYRQTCHSGNSVHEHEEQPFYLEILTALKREVFPRSTEWWFAKQTHKSIVEYWRDQKKIDPSEASMLPVY